MMRRSLRWRVRGFGRLVAAWTSGARGRYGTAIATACLAAGLLALAFVPAAGSGASTSPPSPTQAPTTIVRELPELRSETSDTYVRADGLRVAKISRTPINYRDSSGNWQPISTTLQPSANGSLSATATQLPVTLPSSLSSPVTVGPGDATISFTLEGASGTAAASGSSASYAEALSNLSASYEEQATRLKETLSLGSASAPTVYHYHLSATGGLKAKLLDGTVVFSDAQGHPRYAMPAPTIADAGASGRPDTRDVHYALSEDGSQLELVVSSTWLQSPERVFPVKIDPTTEYWGANVDCFIASEPSYENTSLCGSYLYLGYHPEGSTHSVGRGLLRFELGSSIPEDANILSANLKLTDSYTATSSQAIEVDGLEKTPTNSATWNKYDGTNAWTEKGGDYEKGSPSKQTIAPTGSGHVFSWGITGLVEKWVQSPASNHGLIAKAENETSGESSWISGSGEGHPYIEVLYSPKIGTPSDETFTSQELSDREGLSVNVANGNVLVQNHVLELPGIGYDLSINAFYNNLESSWRTLGMGSILSTGQDVRIEYNEVEGTWAYADPSGAWWRLTRDAADDKGTEKAFKANGLNAIVWEESTGALRLEYLTARVKYYFNNNKHPSYLEKTEDANKNTTTMHYNSEGISSIEDTHGHSITFTHEKTAGGYVSSIKDALGRKWEFAHNSKGQLESIKDPDLHKSKYTYNEADEMTQIEDPDGHLIELSYSTKHQLSEIRHVVNGTATTAGTKDVITTFSYERPAKSSLSCPSGSIGDTEVVSPDGSPEGKADSSASGHTTYYCFNNKDEVTKTIDQRGNESTASYNAGTGTLATYQDPGDTAEGSGSGATNTIAYNGSGAATEVTTGVTPTTSLKTSFAYGTGGGGQVEPSSIQTPFSAIGQKGSSEHTHKSFYGYDSSGNLTSVNQDTETGKPEVKLKYNAQGQVTESTDPNGNVTKYKYSEATGHEKGDLLKIEPPAPLGATELTYDSLDRVHTVKDGREKTATYTYDGEDRVTNVEYSDGSSVSFKYDADGNTTERVDAKSFGEPYTGATLYEYDKLNRPTLETTPTAKTMSYGYDYDGNLTSLEDKGGKVSYAYGSDDVLTSLTEPENSAHPFKFGYQAQADNRESTSYPNGLLQCTKSDRAGRLTSFLIFKPTGEQNCSSSISAGSTLEDYELGYTIQEKVGEETITIDTPDLQTLTNAKAGNATTYSYDTLDRLQKAVTKTGSEAASLTSEYEYDKAGNVLLNHTYSPSTTYSNEHMFYNAANEICAIATTAPSECVSGTEEGVAGHPTYDKDGDMTSDGLLSGANKFAYTVRDQLSSITPHGEAAKQVVSHGTGQDDLAAVGSEEVMTNILGVGVTGSGESAKYYTRGSEGTLLAKRTAKGKPSETEYFLPDPFGSVAVLTGSTGSQTAPSSGSYQYDPYGNPLSEQSQAFMYESAQALPAGLVHFGARYYDPALGSWTQQDPINQASGLAQANRFAFVGGDPINSVDPRGELIDTLLKLGAKYLHAGEHFIFSDKLAKEAAFGGALDVLGKFFLVASIAKYSNECADKLTGGGLEGHDPGSCNVVHLVLP